jgi:hypothetical protein
MWDVPSGRWILTGSILGNYMSLSRNVETLSSREGDIAILRKHCCNHVYNYITILSQHINEDVLGGLTAWSCLLQ